MTEARAVIDIVVAKPRPDQLLEQIGFLVRAFRRAEACNRLIAVLLGHSCKSTRGKIESLLPTRLAEMSQWVGGIDVKPLRETGLPDQRLHEPLRVVHI